MKRLIAGSAVLIAAGVLPGALYAGDLEDQLRKAIDPTLKKFEGGNKPADQSKPQSQPGAAAQPSTEIAPFGSISFEDERKIGSQIAGNLLGAAPLVKDAKLQQYVNKVGRWVAQKSTRPELPWTFGVIEAADINAFAAPGGYVFITRGPYATM